MMVRLLQPSTMPLRSLADYHIHTPLCRHAVGWPLEYARKAVELGLDEIGFADHNPMPENFDDWRMTIDELPRYLRYYEPAIQALVDTGTAFEINTAGLRKDCRELYPAYDFVLMARQAGVPLLINSDAHDPAELAAGFPQAVELARGAGYHETLRFSRRTAHAAPLP